MRLSRWLDHLPPWLSFGALASTGVFEPGEVVAMAAPLVAAGLVETFRLGLDRWRRALGIGVLVLILLDALRRPGLIPVVVHTLFLLCGARLILPRDFPQRRQILLMAFLLFLTTSLTTVNLAFLGWGLAWTVAAAGVLLQLAWEQSAQFRRGQALNPPFRRLLPWSLGALILATGFFLILPRVALGIRPFGLGVTSLAGAQAGFSSRLELGGGGAVAPNADVVLRILPPDRLTPARFRELEGELGLWRGLGLNQFDGRKWESREPQWTRDVVIQSSGVGLDPHQALECYLGATPMGIVPLPYGSLVLEPPANLPLRRDVFHGAIRWVYPQANRYTLRLQLMKTRKPLPEPEPQDRGRAVLTYTGPEAAFVSDWSHRLAPGNLTPGALAARLQEGLRSQFRYTLDNPSGKARNPLADFLERSKAGHCEYFASALALMLRVRGVPARVVNGYRLGPWIPEGGYWLITQNEAHSWVEYFDRETGWRVADPTPPAPPSPVLSPSLMATLSRWMDAAKFSWDRHVVRFSGEDQQAGVNWIQAKAASIQMPDVRQMSRDFTTPKGLGGFILSIGLAWLMWRTRARWMPLLHFRRTSKGLVPLKPLLKRAGPELEPGEGETARQWLSRLAQARPERKSHLERLSTLVDQVAYGGAAEGLLRTQVREEARHWK